MQSPTDTEKLRYLFHLDQVLGKMNMVNSYCEISSLQEKRRRVQRKLRSFPRIASENAVSQNFRSYSESFRRDESSKSQFFRSYRVESVDQKYERMRNRISQRFELDKNRVIVSHDKNIACEYFRFMSSGLILGL